MIKHVLLIDDDRDDHEVFKYELNSYNPAISFFSAYDGLEGLDFLQKQSVHYVFLDINLRRINGIDVLKLIKKDEVLKNIPVIMYSTGDGGIYKKIALDLGAKKYFAKPTTLEGMYKMFETVFENLMI